MKLKSLLVAVAGLLITGSAFAEEAGAAASSGHGLGALAAGLGLGLAALGGGMGQGKATAAALEGISRNPSATKQIQTPMIIGLAMIESLVLYAFVIAILKM